MTPEAPPPDPLQRLLSYIEAKRESTEQAAAASHRDREDAKLASLEKRRRSPWWLGDT